MDTIISAIHLTSINKAMIVAQIGNAYRVTYVGARGEASPTTRRFLTRDALDAFVRQEVQLDSKEA